MTPGSRIGWFSEGPGPRGKKLGVFFFGRVEGRKEGSFPPARVPVVGGRGTWGRRAGGVVFNGEREN